MKKIISFILGAVVALNLSISVANAAANEVRYKVDDCFDILVINNNITLNI